MTAPTHTAPAPPGPSRRKRDRTFGAFEVISLTIAAILVALVGVPLIRVLIGMFWVDGSFTLAPIHKTLAVEDIGTLVLHTLTVVLASSALAFVIGTLLAWINERTDARIGLLTDALPLLPFLLPPVAGAVGWTMLLSPSAGLLNSWIRDVLGVLGVRMESGPFDIATWYGLIWVYAVYAVPFVFLNVSAGLRSLDGSLEEASRLSGAGRFRTLRKVTLPAVAPSLGAGLLLTLWSGFGIFSIPSIIGAPAGIDVLSVRIVELLTFTYPPETDVAVGLSGIVVILVGIAYVLQYRVLRSGRYAALSGKGAKASPTRLGAWKWPIRVAILLYVAMSIALPMLALVLVSLNGYWTPDIDWSTLSLDAWRQSVSGDPTTIRALRNSLLLGVVGAVIGIVAAALVAIYVARKKSILARAIDAGIKLPAAISNMVIAVGILLLLAGAPFYLTGTLGILLLGYLALYLPQASIAADAAVTGVGDELTEASAISGASTLRTFRRIYFPLIMPGLVAGWALLFIRMVGDLTASAILAGTGNTVVGFRILEVYNGGSYALLASLATTLVVITTLVLVIVLSYTKSKSKLGIQTRIGG